LSLTCVSGGSVLAKVSTADASGSLHFCNNNNKIWRKTRSAWTNLSSYCHASKLDTYTC
jgi:hypothetical protein